MTEPVFIPVYRYGRLFSHAWVDAPDAARVEDYHWISCWPHAYAGRRLKSGLPALGTISMHRFILALSPGHGVVHHVNEDPLDNRRLNLKWLPTMLHHGEEPHPRRDARCGRYPKDLPPHEREVALAALHPELVAA